MWNRLWPAARDVASWGLGAWWGSNIMLSDSPGDPWKIQLVAMLLGLPFVFRADELRKARKPEPEQEPSANGHH